MKLTDEQKENMFVYGIPLHMHGALTRYYENKLPPGHFLEAVLNNDLKEAINRADDINRNRIHSYIAWLYNEVPSGSWGYENAVSDWIGEKV